jgi:hypothetical protein
MRIQLLIVIVLSFNSANAYLPYQVDKREPIKISKYLSSHSFDILFAGDRWQEIKENFTFNLELLGELPA